MPKDKTALEVNALKRKEGMHRCAPNLYLLVRPSETPGGGLRSSWVFRYEVSEGGKRKGKNLGLGSTADFTLAEAKKKARKLRQLLAEGVDPLQAKRDEKVAKKLEAAKALTFLAAGKQYVETHSPGWRNKKHRQQWLATFEGSSRQGAATALINDLPVQAIDTALALKVLEPPWKKTPVTAGRVRQRCEKVLDFVTARGLRTGDNPFRWRGYLENLLPRPRMVKQVRNHPAMSITDIGGFTAELRSREGVPARALELTILEATRTSETVNATWNEIDLKERTWTIPAERMKSGKPHKIPLSKRAIEILEGLPREDGNDHLFIGARKGRPLSDMAMLDLLKSMRPGTTVHGFRSTFRSWAAERTNYPHHVCEAALAHSIPDAVVAAYQRSDLFEKRRGLMTAWATFCEQLPGQMAANIVSLKGDAS